MRWKLWCACTLLCLAPTAQAAQVFVPNFSIGNDYVKWYYGCGPTAGGSIYSYWDRQGYGDLIQGAIDDNVASNRHIQYWYEAAPANRGNNTVGSNNDPKIGSDGFDCIADFMGTSRYTDTYNKTWAPVNPAEPYTNTNGESLAWYGVNTNYYGVGSGMLAYAQFRGYNPTVDNWEHSVMGGDNNLTWASFTNEIDAGRPVILLVDTNADGATDHFVPVFGYDTTGNQYFAYDEWGNTGGVGDGGRWETFQGMSGGVSWGVAMMTVIQGFASGGGGASPEPGALLLAMTCLLAVWPSLRRGAR